jgi:hypothetical protein
MGIYVSNVPDTSYEECEGGCGSWIQHWENATDSVAEKCSVIGCHEYGINHLVGAHVYIEEEDEEDDEEYIIPLCKEHNHHLQDILEVRDNTKFVPVGELDTCIDIDEEE